MSRYVLTSLLLGTGLACGGLGWHGVLADEKGPQASSARSRDDAEEDPAKRIDKAIQTYESRADQELQQTRKEIDRLRKELGEMVELQCDMAISLAELQAEMRAQANAASAADSDGDSADAKSSATSPDQERKRLRAIELTREFRGVMENLRNLVLQKRGETDQLVLQLRNLRAQQRQMAAERERSKQGADPSKD